MARTTRTAPAAKTARTAKAPKAAKTAPRTRTTTAPTRGKAAAAPSRRIDERVASLGDWRGQVLARVRALIHQADPDVVETWKWRGVPVWEHDGIICTGETYKAAVKLTFAHGAVLPDPARLFNASLEGGTRRAIDIHDGDTIDDKALKTLVRAAVSLNVTRASRRSR
ncbi:MAG: DUF1801 domain-containing protein [Vicinamibacterales bacterium]